VNAALLIGAIVGSGFKTDRRPQHSKWGLVDTASCVQLLSQNNVRTGIFFFFGEIMFAWHAALLWYI